MKFKRAEKYGFCAGVRIADRKVKKFAQMGGRGHILGQVVHNERVVEEMTQLGIPTAASLDEVTAGTIVFSAHGVPPSFHETARRSGLNILDTTCPFVYDIHEDAARALNEGWHLIFIGDAQHREVVGYTRDLEPGTFDVLKTVEEASKLDFERHPKIKVFYQTTLNSEQYEDVVQQIEARGGQVERGDTICYATKENQDAARALAEDREVDAVVVIGGRHSANTHHLWEICRELKTSFLVHSVDDLEASWFEGCQTVGVTAGASTPDYLIDEVEEGIEHLSSKPLSAPLG